MEAVGVDLAKLFGGVYRGKRVLVTGHTGFKGSWLSLWLYLMGAEVFGYALPPATDRDNFVLCGLQDKITDIRGDVRDKKHLKAVFDSCKPEVVFHLAAQPIVRLSYELPLETLETNILGTSYVLENVRTSQSVRAAVIVTSDKCYENREQIWGYREEDALGGFDPYSASKGCAELVTAAYRKSFFGTDKPALFPKAVSTARAGNVIGGGDWSPDRILPDCIRALQNGSAIGIRNPSAVRPWQFVLEPLYGYLLLASKMLQDPHKYSGAWNFGPDFDSVIPVSKIVQTVIQLWGSGEWQDLSNPDSVHEAGLLNLDCTKAKSLLGWKPKFSIQQALEQTVAWYQNIDNGTVFDLCTRQIAGYCAR